MRNRILHKGLAIITAPLLFQLVFVFSYFSLLSGAGECFKRERHWQDICECSQQMTLDIQQSINFSVLYAISHDPALFMRQKAALIASRKGIKKLINMVQQDHGTLVDVDQLRSAFDGSMHYLSLLGLVISQTLDPQQKLSEGLSFGPVGLDYFKEHKNDDVFRPRDSIYKAESIIEERRTAFDKASRSLGVLQSSMLAVNVLISLALAAYFYFEINRRLSNVKENTRLLSLGKEPAPPMSGSDELAQVDTTVYDCAEQILKLEAFKGQMVAVVSHELKAPLGSIQLILTLFSSGAYGDINEKNQFEAINAEKNLAGLLLLVTNFLDQAKRVSATEEAAEKRPEVQSDLPASAVPMTKRRFGLIPKGMVLVGIPLLINIALLFSLGQIWTNVVAGMDSARQASSVAGNICVIGDRIERYVWVSLLFFSFNDPEIKNLLQRHLDLVRESIMLVDRAKDSIKQKDTEWSNARKKTLKLVADVDKIVKEDVSIAQLRDSGLLPDCLGNMDALSRAQKKETELASNETKSADQTMRSMQILLIANPVFSFSVSILLAVFFARSISGRLANVAVNAHCLANKQKLNAPIGGNDEIADLDQYFHQVASRILDLETEKERMIGIASNDLRTPLKTQLASLQSLQDGSYGPISEKAANRLATAREETGRLIRLINNLLDMDKMQSAQIELDYNSVSLGELLSRALDAVRFLAEKSKITFESSAPDLRAELDEERMIQVLVNLLSNAIKYSPAESTIKLLVESKGEWIEISVSDKGRGIPPGRISTIFDRFQKLDKDDYQLGGTGLGLAISKWLVELHGGKISVESEQGEGSTFKCLLPLRRRNLEVSKS